MTTVLYNGPVCTTCKDRYGISTFRMVSVKTCTICGRRGTLCYFADKDQEIDWTLYQMGNIEFTRASGDATCRNCGKPYREHPNDRRPEAAAYDGTPFLHVLCDGKLVKL